MRRLLSKASRKVEAVTGESSQVHPAFRHDRYIRCFSPVNSTILIFASIRLRNKGAYNSTLSGVGLSIMLSQRNDIISPPRGFDSFENERV